MGKLKTRIKGPGNKGKRWAKGQSSSSNPTIKKHREVAKTRFFQPFLFGPPAGSTQKSGLTEEALKQHTYASESSKVINKMKRFCFRFKHSELLSALDSLMIPLLLLKS